VEQAKRLLLMAEQGFEYGVKTRLEVEDAQWADVVVTMGCGDACPVVPGTRYVDWELADPAGRPLDEVRSIRDEIDARVRKLVAELDRSGEQVLV